MKGEAGKKTVSEKVERREEKRGKRLVSVSNVDPC